ncbi:MAG: hypothetical protein LBU81_08125 [Methanosarcinales archaeon]|nr:hypothetical protein [Methanosarcinales archaeon]
MKFKSLTILMFLALAGSVFSGCIGTDSFIELNDKTVIINRAVIDDNTIIGTWVQEETNSKLVFLNNCSFKWISDSGYYDGTWRIENNTSLILKMDVWDYDQNPKEYTGTDDVSFGSVKGNVLVFSSINDDPEIGFPAGEFIPA